MSQKIIKLLKPYFNLKKNLVILRKKKNTPQIIAGYIKNNQIIKLHLGCGGRVFSGWLNGDINLRSDCYVDVTKKLPFKDGSADFIYSEHLVEHLEYPQAKEFLKECYRVLKPNGILRTAMPDLDFFIKGCLPENQDAETYKKFVQHKNQIYRDRQKLPANMNTALNLICRMHTHKYVYQDKTFIELLEEIGFKNIQRVKPGESEFPELSNLENNPRNRTDEENHFHLLQTMSIEAQKL